MVLDVILSPSFIVCPGHWTSYVVLAVAFFSLVWIFQNLTAMANVGARVCWSLRVLVESANSMRDLFTSREISRSSYTEGRHQP